MHIHDAWHACVMHLSSSPWITFCSIAPATPMKTTKAMNNVKPWKPWKPWSKWARCEIEVSLKWSRSELEVNSKWNRIEPPIPAHPPSGPHPNSYPMLVGLICFSGLTLSIAMMSTLTLSSTKNQACSIADYTLSVNTQTRQLPSCQCSCFQPFIMAVYLLWNSSKFSRV